MMKKLAKENAITIYITEQCFRHPSPPILVDDKFPILEGIASQFTKSLPKKIPPHLLLPLTSEPQQLGFIIDEPALVETYTRRKRENKKIGMDLMELSLQQKGRECTR